MREEPGHKEKILRCLKYLIEQPYRFTQDEIAQKTGQSTKTVGRNFALLRTLGFEVVEEQKRFALLPTGNMYRSLEELLYFTEQERKLLLSAVDQYKYDGEAARRLKPKLEALYDFQRLGHDFLRRPYLERVDALNAAIKGKYVVVLRDYRSSNSNTVRDRRVEPFHVSVAEDMLHAFDCEKQLVRHFRLSRIGRVIELPDTPWTGEALHVTERCDPFYIVSNDQEQVSFEMTVLAFNELVARFPLAKQCTELSNSGTTYHFSGRVNAKFLGLSSFLLGFFGEVVDIFAPDSLNTHIHKELKAMIKKINKL